MTVSIRLEDYSLHQLRYYSRYGDTADAARRMLRDWVHH